MNEKLTGKAKENFEKWYETLDEGVPDEVERFYLYSESMQWGVLVDFFDSVGIRIEIRWDTEEGLVFEWGYAIVGGTGIGFEVQDNFNSRAEARTAAIEKANELYNQKQKS